MIVYTLRTERCRDGLRELLDMLCESGARVCLCFTCKHQEGRVCALCGCRNEDAYARMPSYLL